MPSRFTLAASYQSGFLVNSIRLPDLKSFSSQAPVPRISVRGSYFSYASVGITATKRKFARKPLSGAYGNDVFIWNVIGSTAAQDATGAVGSLAVISCEAFGDVALKRSNVYLRSADVSARPLVGGLAS